MMIVLYVPFRLFLASLRGSLQLLRQSELGLKALVLERLKLSHSSIESFCDIQNAIWSKAFTANLPAFAPCSVFAEGYYRCSPACYEHRFEFRRWVTVPDCRPAFRCLLAKSTRQFEVFSPVCR